MAYSLKNKNFSGCCDRVTEKIQIMEHGQVATAAAWERNQGAQARVVGSGLFLGIF